MIVSTGMCTIEEVGETVALLKKLNTPFALTHCVSAYPTPYDRVNLGMIGKYRELFSVPVGLSDHSRGVSIRRSEPWRSGLASWRNTSRWTGSSPDPIIRCRSSRMS